MRANGNRKANDSTGKFIIFPFNNYLLSAIIFIVSWKKGTCCL